MAVSGISLDYNDVARRISTDHPRFGGKIIEKFCQRSRGDELQRNDRNAVSRLQTLRAVDRTGTRRLARWNKPISAAFTHQGYIADAQRALQHVEDILPRHRPPRRQGDGPLHTRINRVADVQNIAKDHLGYRGDRRILKIHLVALRIGIAVSRRKSTRS